MLRVLSLAVFLPGVAGICLKKNKENLAKAYPQVKKVEQASLCCDTAGGECCYEKMAKETKKGKSLYDACEEVFGGMDGTEDIYCGGCATTKVVSEKDEKEDKCAAEKEDEAEATKLRVMTDICTSMTKSAPCKAIKKGKTKLCTYNKGKCKPKKSKSKQMLNLGKKVKPTKVSG